jgi:hypothetical protein
MQAPVSPNYDDAAFHAQQCAEKYLKARLIEAACPSPKLMTWRLRWFPSARWSRLG